MTRFEDVPLVKDFMKTRVHTASEGEDVLEAARALLEAGHSGAPVVNDDGKLVGVLSEVDCVRVMSSAAFHGQLGPRETTVRAQMTRELESVPPTADLFSCVNHFTVGHHRRLPVVEAPPSQDAAAQTKRTQTKTAVRYGALSRRARWCS